MNRPNFTEKANRIRHYMIVYLIRPIWKKIGWRDQKKKIEEQDAFIQYLQRKYYDNLFLIAKQGWPEEVFGYEADFFVTELFVKDVSSYPIDDLRTWDKENRLIPILANFVAIDELMVALNPGYKNRRD